MIDFPGKRPKEKVLLKIDKHWVVRFKILMKLMIFCATPLILIMILLIFQYLKLDYNTLRIVIIIMDFYFLFWVLKSYINWINDMFDMIIVTNERIIDITQESLFHRNVAQAELQYIQDIKGGEKGFFQSIFHYGEIDIQTASREEVFYIHNVSHPVLNAEKINSIKRDMLSELEKKTTIDEHQSQAGLQ